MDVIQKMTEKEGDLIERIRFDPQKSGFPLEIEVMKLLMGFDSIL